MQYRSNNSRFGIRTFLQLFVRITLAGITIAGAMAIAAPSPPANAASTGVRVGVVIDFGNGTVYHVAVVVSGANPKGLTALQAVPGINITTDNSGAFGAAVCGLDINGTHLGCPGTAGSCLTCADPKYWAYFKAPGGASSFQYSRTGAAQSPVSDGDVEGWKWGTGKAPTFVPFAQFFPLATTTTVAPPTTTPTSVHGVTTTTRAGTGIARTTTTSGPTKPVGTNGSITPASTVATSGNSRLSTTTLTDSTGTAQTTGNVSSTTTSGSGGNRQPDTPSTAVFVNGRRVSASAANGTVNDTGSSIGGVIAIALIATLLACVFALRFRNRGTASGA